MIKKVFYFLLISFILYGCSKENKDASNEIKIEQQNPPPKEVVKDEPKQENKIEEQISTDKQLQQQEQTGQKTPQENLSLKSKQTSKYIGKNATVTGYVADVYKNEKVAYLNFDAKFPKNTFSAVIFKDEFSKFGDINKYKNQTVEVSGVISEYKGKPQLILKNTSQVKIK